MARLRMRFNLVGPDLPRPNAFLSALTFKQMPVWIGTLLICVGIVVASILFRTIAISVAYAHDDGLKAELKKQQQIAMFGLSERAELAGFAAAASHYGEVRDSGYTVAKALVRVANVWPDPRQVPASLKCYTPSDDGTSVMLTGVAGDYKAYAATVSSLRRKFMVVPAEDPKGSHYEMRLKVNK